MTTGEHALTPPYDTELAPTAPERLEAKVLLGLCLDASQELPLVDVVITAEGNTAIRNWVITRLEAMAYNAQPTWLETVLPMQGTKSVVSKLGTGHFDAEPTVVLEMKPSGEVESEAPTETIIGYTALLRLRLGRF